MSLPGSRSFHSLTRAPKRGAEVFYVRQFSDLPPHIELCMPALSPTMSEGNLAAWKKKEGDFVAAGDVIAEIETDKATVDFESVEEGYIAKILIPEGSQGVPVGTPVALMAEEEGDIGAFGNAVGSVQSEAKDIKEKEPERSSAKTYPEYQEVTMPALSPTMSEGVLAVWRKKEGEFVNAGDVLAEVETDKATVDFESVEEGYLAKILVPAGSGSISVGKLVAVMVEEKEDISAFDDFTDDVSVAVSSTPKEKQEVRQPEVKAAVSKTSDGSRVFASPLARSLATEKGIDLSSVKGTGYNGRIVADDVATFKAPQKLPQQEKQVQTPQKELTSLEGDFEDIPNSNMRKAIAKRLLESKQQLPHYYLTVEVNMDKLLALRGELNSKIDTGKLSVNDFIIKAAAAALRKVPAVNSSWTDKAIRQYNYVDISIAVSTESGLITPIIKDADKKGLLGISNGVKDLATRARDGKLRPEEFQGGTFTISNLGMFGVSQFSAIINPPQSAILAVGASETKVVMTESKGEQILQNCSMMNVTLSCDHRVIDGAVGAQWLKAFKENCEDPAMLLL